MVPSIQRCLFRSGQPWLLADCAGWRVWVSLTWSIVARAERTGRIGIAVA